MNNDRRQDAPNEPLQEQFEQTADTNENPQEGSHWSNYQTRELSDDAELDTDQAGEEEDEATASDE